MSYPYDPLDPSTYPQDPLGEGKFPLVEKIGGNGMDASGVASIGELLLNTYNTIATHAERRKAMEAQKRREKEAAITQGISGTADVIADQMNRRHAMRNSAQIMAALAQAGMFSPEQLAALKY